MGEADVWINGRRLNSGQALTIRVALSNFQSELSDPEYQQHLGDIGPLYLERVNEVMKFVINRPAALSETPAQEP